MSMSCSIRDALNAKSEIKVPVADGTVSLGHNRPLPPVVLINRDKIDPVGQDKSGWPVKSEAGKSYPHPVGM